MPTVSEFDGVIVNNVTLAQYKALKASGGFVASQTYVITDLDSALDCFYWQLRAGRVIPAGSFLFLNQSAVDFSNAPLNTTLVTLTGQTGVTANMTIQQKSGRYELVATVSNGAVQTLATGETLSSMTFAQEYLAITTAGYGLFCKVSFVHDSVKALMDGAIRVENNDF